MWPALPIPCPALPMPPPRPLSDMALPPPFFAQDPAATATAMTSTASEGNATATATAGSAAHKDAGFNGTTATVTVGGQPAVVEEPSVAEEATVAGEPAVAASSVPSSAPAMDPQEGGSSEEATAPIKSYPIQG